MSEKRRGPAWAFSALLVVMVMSIASSAYAITLAAKSKTDYCIVIASDASAPEKTAATELRQYLKQVTGADFVVKTEYEVKAGAPRILVGQSASAKRLVPDVDWTGLKHDGIVIRTVGSDLVLAGGQPRGTLYAVYTFLEDTVGVRWWTGTESFVPKKRTLSIPDLNVVYAPKLQYREAHYRDPNENPLFAAKLKMNGFFYNIPPEYGSHYRFIGFVHTFYGLIPPDKHFKDHPEWFSEIDGKRTTDRAQLCLINDEMRKELTRNALEAIRKDPTAGIISISQNDCHNPCQCAKCKAVVAEEGSEAGPMIRFVNAVAADIEKEFPDIWVETLAYQYTRKPPLHVKPRNNVVVRLCSIECDFSKPLDSEANKAFRDDMVGWKAVAPNIFIWDYVTDFARYLQPHPNMRVLAPNIRFFVENNTIGLFEQGDSYTTTGDFIRLRTWLLAHLEWDPSRDERKLISEFLAGYYGAAAPYLQEYLNLIHDTFDKSGIILPCYNTNLSFLTPPIMNQATELFAKAEKSVADDPVLARRVRRERLPLDYTWLVRYRKLQREVEESPAAYGLAGPKDPVKLCREFIDLSREWKTNFFSEGSPFESHVPELEMMFTPIPMPEEFGKLPKEDCIQIMPDQFFLYGAPDWAGLVKDPLSTTGAAARMPGNHNKYGVQYQITDDLAKRLDGNWKCYAIARCETGSQEPVIRCGVFDRTIDKSRAWFDKKPDKATAGEYRTYYLGSYKLTSSMYFWVAPSANEESTKAIYVDRFVMVRDK